MVESKAKIDGEMYFTSNPNSDHHYQNFDFELLGQTLHFITDSGVFSKSTVEFSRICNLAERESIRFRYWVWSCGDCCGKNI